MSANIVDWFSLIEKECVIPASQVDTLRTTPFARYDHKDDIDIDNDNDNDNDMWAQSSDDDPDDINNNIVGITFCSPPPSPSPLPNDVILRVSGQLGLIRDELGFEPNKLKSIGEIELGFEPNKLKSIGEIELGFEPNKLKSIELGLIGERKRVRDDLDDLGFPTAKKLMFSDGGDTQEINVGDDTEEIIECDVNTEIITDEEEENEEDEVTMDRDSSENARECLVHVLRLLTDSQEKQEDVEVDFLETAIRRGYTFPPPRWKLQ